MIFAKKTFWFALCIPAVVGWFGGFSTEETKKPFHTASELAFFKKNRLDPTAKSNHFSHEAMLGDPVAKLVIDSNILFPTGRVCGGCHGRDTQGIALVNSAGQDVNIYDDWRASIMGNAARDPFWRAKVEHESLTNPAHALALQDKCTSCHAPTGHYQAFLHDKKQHYGLAELVADTIGQDGVTCQACHAQSYVGIGSRNSGDILFDTTRVAYGPYEQVFFPPMQQFVGITPKYGDHIPDGGLCASCHTLLTNVVDLSGQLTGKTFVEQATYHEWLNSKYKSMEVTCQTCHIPQDAGSVIPADNYVNIQPKYPFGVHELAGANTLMLNILKENRAALGIEKVLPELFDSSIEATRRMLQKKSLDITLSPGTLSGDTAFFNLKLVNKAGHKFPSGYPSRRAFVQLFVTDATTGDTLFSSGAMNPDFTLKGEPALLTEPHHDVIRSSDEVQIYELVAADVNGDFTTILERSATAMKDNRLPPLGFKKSSPVYDTTRIVGAAENDPDFNILSGAEGWGGDIVHFHVPVNGFSGKVNVTARVLYQSIPQKWMNEVFQTDAPLINNWKSMYYAADRSPVVVAEAQLSGLYISSVASAEPESGESLLISPNPTFDGRFFLHNTGGEKVGTVKVFAADGREAVLKKPQRPGQPFELPASEKGAFIVVVETEKGTWARKLVKF